MWRVSPWRLAALTRDAAAMVERRLDEIFARFRGAKCRMGGQCNVLQCRQGVTRGQGLESEHVESGMTDMPRAQRLNHGLLVNQRAARRVHKDGAPFHRCDASTRKKPLGLLV